MDNSKIKIVPHEYNPYVPYKEPYNEAEESAKATELWISKHGMSKSKVRRTTPSKAYKKYLYAQRKRREDAQRKKHEKSAK